MNEIAAFSFFARFLWHWPECLANRRKKMCRIAGEVNGEPGVRSVVRYFGYRCANEEEEKKHKMSKVNNGMRKTKCHLHSFGPMLHARHASKLNYRK